MRIIWAGIVLMLLLGTVVASATDDPKQIMAKVRAGWQSADEIDDVTAQLMVGDKVMRTLRFTLWQSWRPTGDLARIQFTDAEHAGQQFLTRGRDQWLKVEGVKARRVVMNQKGKEFAQTDFFHEDLEGWRLEDYDYTHDGSGGNITDIIAIPRRDSVYGKLIIAVDTQKWVIAGIEFYDKTGVLWKTQDNTVAPYRQAKPGVWRPTGMLMVNNKTGHKTRVTIIPKSFAKINDTEFALHKLEDE